MKKFLKKSISIFVIFFATSTVWAGTQEFDKQMEPVLKQYLQVQKTLAADEIKGLKELAMDISKSAAKVDPKSVAGEHADHYKNVPMNLKKAADALANSKDIKSAREAFKKMSMPMAMWAGMSKPKGINVMYCSMAKASWLQKSGDVKNPYYGNKMLACGEVVK